MFIFQVVSLYKGKQLSVSSESQIYPQKNAQSTAFKTVSYTVHLHQFIVLNPVQRILYYYYTVFVLKVGKYGNRRLSQEHLLKGRAN